jgi:hypothetical protein
LNIDAGRLFANLTGMTLRTRNRLITFSVLAGPFIFLLGLLLFWEAEPLPPITPLPNPNGYDNLVKAGTMVSNEFGNYDELSLSSLRVLVNQNTEAFQIGRTGLQQECRVVLDYSPASSTHLDQLSALKRLALGFVAEGRLAENENRVNEAAGFYLDTIRLGNQSAHGGVVIDQMVGLAFEAFGVANLQKIVGRLNADTCRETANELELLDSQRQTWTQVMQQESDWSHRAFPGIRNEIGRIASHRELQSAYNKAGKKINARVEQTRQLIIELAARAYELDKGHPPANLADLVPDYLKAVPQDPLTGTNMIYSPR